MATFPTALPSYLGFTASHTLAADLHASQHNSEQADIVAIATKIGTSASTPTVSKLLRGTGTGTSAWAQADLTTDVTGVLPVANGGNGTTSTTGTGSAVFATSPTLISPTLSTPTIANFSNANHNHQNATGGGTLGAAAMPTLDLNIQSLSNPYKFRVYLSSAQNTAAAAYTVVLCDAKSYDTNSNVDIVTHKGRFTAPVAGFYQFNGAVQFTGLNGTGVAGCALYKNGSVVSNGNFQSTTAFSNAGNITTTVGDILSLAANDFIEFNVFCSAAVAIVIGATNSYFSGCLVSTT